MARMFGTDGVRGVAGSELTIELATKLGQRSAHGNSLAGQGSWHTNQIWIPPYG